MEIPKNEVAILRDLAQRVAQLAAEPRNSQKIEHWTKLTDLASDYRPATLIHLWPLAWSEVLPDEDNLLCEHEPARMYERDMRRRIWSVENLQDDTVIEPIIRYPHCVESIPYKELSVERTYSDDDHERTGAAKFEAVIKEPSDIEKIGDPIVNVDFGRRKQYQEEAEEIFGGILDVIPSGVYFSAKVIDDWVAMRGMGQLYIDMMDDPAWTHEALQRITDNFLKRFKLCEDLGVWGPWESTETLGSSGLRFNPEIPNYQEIMQQGKALLKETWGSTMAEGFTCVSPAMHESFSVKYDLQLMHLFKHVNVGCCEVLSSKVEYVRRIPNARRISISEWCDFERAGEEIGTDLLYGFKPSGVPFLGDRLHADIVREEIRRVLHAAKDCHMEIILNIGGTLGGGNGAEKLIEWSRIVSEEITSIHG